MYPKYYKKVFLDTRTNLIMEIFSYYTKNPQIEYWCRFRRPKGKKIIKKECIPESTITKLQKYLKEIT